MSGVLDNLDFRGRVVGVASFSPDLRLLELLEKKGATVRVLSESTASDKAALELYDLLLGAKLDAAVFSTPSQFDRLWEIACMRGGTGGLRAALGKLRIVALGSAVELALRQHGIRVDEIPPRSLFVRPQPSELVSVFGLSDRLSEKDPEPNGAPAPGTNGKSSGAAHQTVVVIGNGMVGWKLCERLTELDTERRFQIVTFCEEPRPAYDRVGLTSFFEKSSADEMLLAGLDWYKERGIRVLLNERATELNRKRRAVRSSSGEWVPYDVAVLATGSSAFVPPIPGVD
jgi:hypothetical protein